MNADRKIGWLLALALLLLTSPVLLIVAVASSEAQAACDTSTGAAYTGPGAPIPPPQGPGRQHAQNPVASSIPANILPIYESAGGKLWPILAGIGYEETRHGAAIGISSAGAIGFMQFMPGTWAIYGNGGDPNDPKAAIPAAWRMLSAAGPLTSTQAIRNAIFSYNHAWWYVDDVLWWAKQYAAEAGHPTAVNAPSTSGDTAQPANVASSDCAAAPTGPGTPLTISAKGCTKPIIGAVITQQFGVTAFSPKGHPGMDLAAAAGTPILAACDGIVELAGPAQGYGSNFVQILHAGFATSYGHMQAMFVTAGQQVKAGQRIGLEGCEGDCTGPHLHFEIRTPACTLGVGCWGPVTDPVPVMAGLGVPLL